MLANTVLVYCLGIVAMVCTVMVVVDNWSWTGTVLALAALAAVGRCSCENS